MIRTVLAITVVVIVLAALYAARAAVMLIYVSVLVAMGFAPLVKMIEQPHPGARGRRVPRLLAIGVIYFTVVAAFVIVGIMVVPPLVDQAERLWAGIPRHYTALQSFFIRHHLLAHRISLAEAVENAPAGTTGNTVTTVFFAVWSLVGGLFGIVTMLILSFYLLIEAESLFNYVVRFVPASRRGAFATVSREIVEKVSAWLRAQVLLAGVMGTFAAVGLAAMHVPYFYVIALVAAVGETIPIVGPIVAGVTAVAIAFSSSPRLALFVGVYFLVLHQLEANVLVPKIMEKRVGVSPVTVMVALLVGVELWGLIGAILAIPTAAILSVVVEVFAPRADAPAAENP